MIKYHYAFDENKQVVSIEEIDREHRHEHHYTCINCGGELISKLGEVNAHHFAHTSDTECGGGFESYLHELAKYLFKKRFEEGKSIRLKYSINEQCCLIDSCTIPIQKEECCHQTVSKFIDVHKYYDTVLVEKVYRGFKPDILLVDSKGKHNSLLIEIFVTHKCDEYKIRSGLPIFEIKIKTEEDAKKLYTEYIILGETYNFNQQKFRTKESLGIKLQTYTFVLNYNGFSLDTWHIRNCNELKKPYNGNSALELFYYEIKYNMSSLLLKAKELGFNIKDCRICSYYKLTNGWLPKWVCCLYKEGRTPHYPDTRCAYGCPCYSENSRIERIDADPFIIHSYPKHFNSKKFSSIYTEQMKNMQNKMIVNLPLEQNRREEEHKSETVKKQKNENKINQIALNWFSYRFDNYTFKLVCDKDDVPSGYISKNTEIFEDQLLHLDFKSRFNAQKKHLSDNILELYNKNYPDLNSLYIIIKSIDNMVPQVKNDDKMMIYVYIDQEGDRLTNLWHYSYVLFEDSTYCVIPNKKKIIDELVSYNYK